MTFLSSSSHFDLYSLETDSLSPMPIVSKVQKSLADLQVLHSTGSSANLFTPTAVGQNSQNKVKNLCCQEKILLL